MIKHATQLRREVLEDKASNATVQYLIDVLKGIDKTIDPDAPITDVGAWWVKVEHDTIAQLNDLGISKSDIEILKGGN